MGVLSKAVIICNGQGLECVIITFANPPLLTEIPHVLVTEVQNKLKLTCRTCGVAVQPDINSVATQYPCEHIQLRFFDPNQTGP